MEFRFSLLMILLFILLANLRLMIRLNYQKYSRRIRSNRVRRVHFAAAEKDEEMPSC